MFADDAVICCEIEEVRPESRGMKVSSSFTEPGGGTQAEWFLPGFRGSVEVAGSGVKRWRT